jgi:hypothetical protein
MSLVHWLVVSSVQRYLEWPTVSVKLSAHDKLRLQLVACTQGVFRVHVYSKGAANTVNSFHHVEICRAIMWQEFSLSSDTTTVHCHVWASLIHNCTDGPPFNTRQCNSFVLSAHFFSPLCVLYVLFLSSITHFNGLIRSNHKNKYKNISHNFLSNYITFFAIVLFSAIISNTLNPHSYPLPDRPARRVSLYRLSYPDPQQAHRSPICRRNPSVFFRKSYTRTKKRLICCTHVRYIMK